MVATLGDPRAALLEDFPSVDSWWARYIGGQMRMVSPKLDGTDLQLTFETPFDVVKKALGTTTAGAWNPLFSYLLQTTIVQDANTYNFFPKEPWRGPRTFGWRVKTVAAIASGVGIAEGAAVPADADATYVEVEPIIREFTHPWGMNKRLLDAVSIADTITWDQDVEQHTLDFFKAFNKDLWVALAGVEGNNVEGLRNLLSSYSELTGKTLGANTIDPWLTVDRDAGASWADANALHESGTDRDLSVGLIDSLREAQEPYWDGPNKLDNKAYVTGYSTHGRWSRLEAAKQRYGTVWASYSIGGVKTSAGDKGGFKLAGWDEMPIVREFDMTTETIPDIALFDLNHWRISQLRPFEMADEDNPFVTGFKRRALWYGSGNVTVDAFKGSGVLTDLK